ncbi:MAG: tRNA (adenosine(37)-N6)-threonylcarbamoyltransferase complex transferase subunit TsaD [Spirochaetia bacterium]
MKVLGIETSCDECSAAVVEDGRRILSNVVATQIEIHREYNGVVPEIASRTHTEWVWDVVDRALEEADISADDIDGVAVTSRPGLVGSLLVGVAFAKGFAYSLGVPFVGIDHIKAHLYAPFLEGDLDYPYAALLVSGGHTILGVVEGYDDFIVYGTTIDDACGEAFDKVAKYYELGYPGGVVIDRLAEEGDPSAFDFPFPSLHKGDHRYDVSYSGLKTAVITQADQFWDGTSAKNNENIAASFRRAAVAMLTSRVKRLLEDTGLAVLAVGGGVAANTLLRRELGGLEGIRTVFPSPELCSDNGAMIAGIGYHYLKDGLTSDLDLNASARVPVFRRSYP